MDMRIVAVALVIQISVGLLVDMPVAAAGRPSQAHVAISLGDGRTIEAKKRGKLKTLKSTQQGIRKSIRKR
jgi:cell wall-associated NlpC family hydrolase